MALTSPRALQLGQLEGSSRLSIPGQVHTKREGRVWGGVCSGSQGEAGLAPLPWVIPASQLSLTGTKRKHGEAVWMEMPKPSPAHCGSYWLVSNDILHLFMSLGGVNHGSSLEKCRFLAQ